MKIFANLLTEKLTKNEKKILDFIESNPEDFINNSITEIGSQTNVSIAAVTRFVQRIGFDSIKDLKKFLILEKERQFQYYTNSMNLSEIESIEIFYKHSIETTASLLDKSELKRATKFINKAERVIAIGIGTSLIAAQEMQNSLLTIGKSCLSTSNVHEIAVWSKTLNIENVVVVIFSKQFNSHEYNFLLNCVKKFKIKSVIVTTNTNIKPVQNISVINFQTLEQKNRVVPISSKISQLYIVDVIVQKLIKTKKLENNEFYDYFKKNWRS